MKHERTAEATGKERRPGDSRQLAAGMYCEYLSELRQIQGDLPGQGTFMERFESVWEAEDTVWHFLYDGKNVAGFVVIGLYPNCHPAADYYIEEAYVTPSFRGRGLMKDFILRHTREHGTVYCMFVLTKNVKASAYWDYVFSLAGYEPLLLSEVAKPEPLLVQKGYRAKEKKRKGWTL